MFPSPHLDAMFASAITWLLARHLGSDAHGSGLLAARSFRSIDVTLHRTRPSAAWEWGGWNERPTHSAAILTGAGNGVPHNGGDDAPERLSLGLLPPGT